MNIIKKLAVIVAIILTMANLSAQDIIMGTQQIVNGITEDLVNFYDPGGIPENMGANADTNGYFDVNLKDTIVLKHSMNNNFVLYAYFEEFVMGHGDTLWIFDGEGCNNNNLIGVYSAVASPGEVYSTGTSLTFVFHSDDINDPGLSDGWRARIYAYRKNPENFKFMNDLNVQFTCNAKFYDSGGENGNIASNNENSDGYSFITFHSPAETHIKCEFTKFQVNGIMKIYDGNFYDENKRLIGQFCTSTLDGTTNNMPPVLFSTSSELTFVYVGASGDVNKAGWAANISCIAELFESTTGSPCPQITNTPGGAYSQLANSQNPHVIEFNCANPVVLLEAAVIATGRYSNDYTVKSIPYNEDEMLFAYNAGTSIGANSDDAWLAAINLPFTFTFFGKQYNQVYPGTNGLISLNPQSGYCYFSYPQPAANPPYSSVPYNPTSASSSPYRNAIYGVFEDIDCRYFTNKNDGLGNGAVKVGVLGTAPCRAFVFNYLNVGLFGLTSNSTGSNYNNYNTYQMVIYEGTNIIDVYVKHRACCATTNNSNKEGIIGLQNNTSSQILIAPGRGMTGWNADNEAWRFTPITPLDEYGSLTWYKDVICEDSIISYSENASNRRITVSPLEDCKIISEYVYINASGTQLTLRDTTTILVKIPSIELSRSSGTQNICPNDEVTISVTASDEFPGVTPESYLWSTGATTQSAIVTPDTTQTYEVTVTYNNGCTRSGTIKVDVTELELPQIDVTRDTICIGETTTLVASHPTTQNFTWSTGQTTPSINVSPEVSTNYEVQTIMAGGCIVKADTTIVVNQLPQPAFIANPTEIFVENGVGTVTCTDISQDNYYLVWNFGDLESNTNIAQNVSMATHEYIRAGYYTITLTATDDAGCVDSTKQRVSVTVPYFFYIPSAFSPNGDGINEQFAPKGEGVDPDNYLMQIYDRNGMLVFNTTNPYDYWDGRNKYGKMCPDGVYVYIIRLVNLNGDDKEYTGSVTLLK